MRTAIGVAMVALLVAGVGMAQQFVALGAGFNSTASPQASGWAAYAKPLSEGGSTYSFSTTQFVAGKPVTVETGVAQRVFQQGIVAVMGLGTAGAAMGTDNIGSAFSGGGIVTVDVTKWLKGGRVVVGCKASKTALTDVRPAFLFGFAWGF